jgi:hypothetical protein
MKAFFFGAGSSSGTLGGWPEQPPVSSEFGAVLSTRCPSWQREYPGLAEVVDHLGGQVEPLSLVRIWTCIDYWAKLGPILPSQPQWNPRATWDLKRVLLELYGSPCDKAASRLAATQGYTLGDLFTHHIHPGDILISFNYDTLVERVAEKFGVVLISPHQRPQTGSVTLAKPHGSVSWRMDWRSRRVSWTEADGRVATMPMDESQVGPDQEPLLLGAVPIKSELVREVQKVYFADVWNVVTAQWNTAVRAVRDATSLVFVGYGFPSEDQYGRFLLGAATKMRPTCAPAPAVEFYELPQQEACTKAAIHAVLGGTDLCPEAKGQVTRAPLPLGQSAG